MSIRASLVILFLSTAFLQAQTSPLVSCVEETVVRNISEYNADDIYVIQINDIKDQFTNERMQVFEIPSKVSDILVRQFNKEIKKIEFCNGGNIFALEQSYMIFLFRRNESDGLSLHYNVKMGIDTFNYFPAKRKGRKMMICGAINLFVNKHDNFKELELENGKLKRPSTNYRVISLKGWRQSKIHAQFLTVLRSRK